MGLTMTKVFTVQGESTATVFFANATVADDTKFPCYWARPIIGEVRQVAVVKWSDGHKSVLDNKDGTALIKFQEGWWPNRPHRGLIVVETDDELFEKRLPENEWKQYDQLESIRESMWLDQLQESFYKDDPQYIRLKSLKATLRK